MRMARNSITPCSSRMSSQMALSFFIAKENKMQSYKPLSEEDLCVYDILWGFFLFYHTNKVISITSNLFIGKGYYKII
jgi:hypothetical protein